VETRREEGLRPTIGRKGGNGLAWVREICTIAGLLLFCIGCWPHSGERDWTSVLETVA